MELLRQIVGENQVIMQVFAGFCTNDLSIGSSEIKYRVAIGSLEHVFPAFYVGSQLEEELSYKAGRVVGLLCGPSGSLVRTSDFHLWTHPVEGLLGSLVACRRRRRCPAAELERMFTVTNDQQSIYIKKQLECRNEICTQSSWLSEKCQEQPIKIIANTAGKYYFRCRRLRQVSLKYHLRR